MAKQKKSRMKVSFGDRMISVVTYVVYSLFAFVCAYPFYYIFINSISNNDLSKRGKVLIWPKEIHFNNYSQVMQIQELFGSFKISLARTVLGTLLTVIVAAFLGYMFTRETLWKRKFWYRFVTVTMYFNAGVIPWYITMDTSGLPITSGHMFFRRRLHRFTSFFVRRSWNPCRRSYRMRERLTAPVRSVFSSVSLFRLSNRFWQR